MDECKRGRREVDPVDWEPHEIARLIQLWDEGVSTAKIGRAINRSKNAVIGKAHRLGLPSRGTPVRKGKPITERLPKKRQFIPMQLPKLDPLPIEAPKAIYGPPPPPPPSDIVVEFKAPRPRQCEWLDGVRWAYRRCEGHAARGSWCPEHHARVFYHRPNTADAAD